MRLVLIAWAGLLVLRTALAAHLGLFGDEAFYWQCAQQLDWAYADHPFMTALLVRVGTAWLGVEPLGVRAAFVLLGAAVPLLILVLARRTGDRAHVWRSMGWAMLLPGLAFATCLAVPDVPLLVADLGALIAVARATDAATPDPRRRGFWLLAGACGALALATHYRALLMVAGVAGYLVSTRRGRAALATGGPWAGGLVMLAGFLPALVHNLEHDFAPLRYQFAERHGSSGIDLGQLLLQPLEQAAFVTPLLWITLLATAVVVVRRARSGDDRCALLAWFSLTHLLVYWIASPLSDTDHARVHWPLPGYLPLLVAAPGLLAGWAARSGLRRTLARLVPASAVLTLAALVFDAFTGAIGISSLHGPFLGWDQMGAAVTARRASPTWIADLGPRGDLDPRDDDEPRSGRAPPVVLVADDYATGAALAFALARADDPGDGAPRPPVFVLDHRHNDDHGRQAQYDVWSRDETSLLRTRAGHRALLVVEGAPRPARRQRLEALLGPLREVERLDTERGGSRRSFLLLAGRVTSGPAPPRRDER